MRNKHHPLYLISTSYKILAMPDGSSQIKNVQNNNAIEVGELSTKTMIKKDVEEFIKTLDHPDVFWVRNNTALNVPDDMLCYIYWGTHFVVKKPDMDKPVVQTDDPQKDYAAICAACEPVIEERNFIYIVPDYPDVSTDTVLSVLPETSVYQFSAKQERKEMTKWAKKTLPNQLMRLVRTGRSKKRRRTSKKK